MKSGPDKVDGGCQVGIDERGSLAEVACEVEISE